MQRQRVRQTGFSAVVIVLVVVVVGAIIAAGVLVYQRQRDGLNGTTANTTQPTGQHQSSQQQTTSDVYASWKTYCDSLYHYCFKYPQDWTLTADTGTKLGDTVGASVSNPAKTVGISYVNAYTQDSSLQNFMPVSLDKLTGANQDLSIVGGYIPTSGDNGLAGNNVPGYWVVDTALLSTYPLVVGTESQFTVNPRFSDKDTGNLRFTGRLAVGPSVRMNSLDETRAWFANADTKTSLLILTSFTYQPKS